MEHLLDNPVFNALLSGDKHLSLGTTTVKYFHPDVSPFAGFNTDVNYGFQQLSEMLPAGRRILYATRAFIKEPPGWLLQHEIKGLQFVFNNTKKLDEPIFELIPLQEHHVPQMVALASLTKPGPFASRTIDFGNYYGIFSGKELIAMTGQRLHVDNYSEVSAVCTHPEHLGKGYAAALLQHQVGLIQKTGQIPFLHVRADNERAIALYLRLGFEINGFMNFYFLKKM